MYNVTLRLNARLRPLDRGDIYEDPILAALEESGSGTVSGGGTMMSENGEVEYSDVELELDDNNKCLETLLGVIENIGVPKGSRLIPEVGGDIPAGTLEGLALYINGTELPAEVYKNSDINFVIEKIGELLGEAGNMYSYWEGSQNTGLYFYGASFDEMKSRMESFLAEYPLCQKCRVVQIA